MRVTQRTKEILDSRRFSRDMRKRGYQMCEPHWQLIRGAETDKILTDAVIDIDGKHIWYKVGSRK